MEYEEAIKKAIKRGRRRERGTAEHTSRHGEGGSESLDLLAKSNELRRWVGLEKLEEFGKRLGSSRIGTIDLLGNLDTAVDEVCNFGDIVLLETTGGEGRGTDTKTARDEG